MISSLYGKLALALMILTIGLTVCLLWISHTVSDQYSQEVTQRLNESIAMYVTEQEQLISGGQVNHAALTELANRAMTINPSVEVYVLDNRGNVISHVLPEEAVLANKVKLEPLQAFLADGARRPILGDDPRNPDQSKVFSVAPVMEADKPVGYLYVVLGGEKYNSLRSMVEESYILKMGTAAILGSLLVALVVGSLLFFGLTRRLVDLQRRVERFDITGEPLNGPAKVNDDEIGRLDVSFHEMGTKLQNQFKALQNLDATRRELIANVSHDLRTPLASMQGYLETLLIKDDLDSNERRTYLQTAHKHSQKLNGLIGELFELAKLDSGAIEIKSEVFSLTELVFDSVQDYQLIANERQIDLSVKAEDDQCFVNADIALIQRVLQNLLDNALKHTPAGESVMLSVTDHDNRAVVQVTDTGSGIATHEIPHIFDRFYYASQNDSRAEIGSGLGLAIVKRILDLHQSTIKVTSQLKKGTSFVFELPLQVA